VQPPLTVAIAHSKGGVGKTTTTVIVGKFLARDYRVALKDYDDTRQLTDLVRSMSGDDERVTNHLRLANADNDAAGWRRAMPEVVLIDAEPARGPRTWQALQEADYVLVPAPPEGLAIRALRQMFETIDLVRQQGNPTLQIMGVVPTMFDKRWPEHLAFLEEMDRECRQARVHLFPPVARRQSYLYLSTRGQDYRPVADAVARAVDEHRRVNALTSGSVA
jgi:cellulose biosynthesis protein BcsQ